MERRSAPPSDDIDTLKAALPSGRCPPEDVGGPWGYQEAREALADPSHERHQEIAEWWGADPRDLDTIDIPAIEAEIAKLARRWNRKPRTKK